MMYRCDSRFHVEILKEMLNTDPKIGFIIIDGNGCLFGLLQGNHREVLHKFSVSIAKKHGRGGQSALRFARLRMESRKNELGNSNIFDARLQEKLLKTVDIAYGDENGFNQAIDLSSDVLSDVRFISEKQIIAKFFDEINKDTGKYIFGTNETMIALESGCVEKLICWEDLDIIRQISHDKQETETVKYIKSGTQPIDGLKIIEETSLLEWIVKEHKNYGAALELVSDKSQEGSQFVRGFGGIGATLRYPMSFDSTTLSIDEEIEGIDLNDY